MLCMSEDEFRGVHFVEQGSLRIPQLTLRVDDSVAAIDPIQVEIRTDIWQHWMALAVRHAAEARGARATNLGIDAVDFNEALVAEPQESLIAVSAAAFALEAFRESVLHHVPSARIAADSADGRIHQSLIHAFVFPQAAAKAWRQDLKQVFRLRDSAVHPSAAFATPGLHSAYPVAMDSKYLKYSCENGTTVARMAWRLIQHCLRNPRATHAELSAWCEGALDYLPPEPPINAS